MLDNKIVVLSRVSRNPIFLNLFEFDGDDNMKSNTYRIEKMHDTLFLVWIAEELKGTAETEKDAQKLMRTTLQIERERLLDEVGLLTKILNNKIDIKID